MKKYARDRRPYVKPVTRLELTNSNVKLRWIGIALLLAIAVAAIGYGFSLVLGTEPGWQEVASISDELSCGDELTLMYDFSAGDVNPTVRYQKLEDLYTELTESAYRIFSPIAEGTDNLYYINANPNQTVTVDPQLYRALEQIVDAGNRHVFLGPVRELYDAVFLCESDAEAALFDPMKEPTRAELAWETASYCADPNMIRLELAGENQARLCVSEAYLAFAEEYGIEIFLDLSWMTNAFIVDYIAESLAAQGYVCGYLSSYDGYTRNLDIRSTHYSQNVFHYRDHTLYKPAVLDYSGPMSVVTLRQYPMSDRDRLQYYAYADGSITSVFLDPADGISRTSVDGIMAYSPNAGCADILLKIAPVFIAEDFDAEALEILAREGIQSVRCHENTVVCTEDTRSVQIADDRYSLTLSGAE